MDTIKINGREVQSRLADVVGKVLSYAEDRHLVIDPIQWGWSIKVKRRPIFQIQVSGREVGIVLQFRWMST